MRQLLLCGFLITVIPLRAEVIWNTIGSGAFVVSLPVGQRNGTNVQWAVAFKPSATYTLTSIAVALSVTTGPGVLTVALVTDADGVPGTPIETFRITDVQVAEPAIYTIPSIEQPRLDQNTQYWIVASATSPTQMMWSNTSDSSSQNARLEAFREKGQPWSVIADPYVPGVIVQAKTTTTLAADKRR